MIPAGPRWQKRAGASSVIAEDITRLLRAELRPVANPVTTAWGQHKTHEDFRKVEQRKKPKVAAYKPIDVAYVIKFAAAQRKPGPIPTHQAGIDAMLKEAQWAGLGALVARLGGFLGRRAGTFLPRLGGALQRGGSAMVRSAPLRAANWERWMANAASRRIPTLPASAARQLPPAKIPVRAPAALEPHPVNFPGAHKGLPPSPTAAGGAAAGTAAKGGKMGLIDSYKSVFQPGGMKALWADKWIRYPTYISAAMQAPAVLRGEQDPLTAAFNILAPLPAFRAGVIPGLAASFAAPAISSRFMGGGQQQLPPPPPQASQAPVTINMPPPSMPMQMPAMPQMPSMIPGVRTV